MKVFAFLIFISSFVEIQALADSKATLFEQGSSKTKKIYTLEYRLSPQDQEGVENAILEYRDLDGALAHQEKSQLKGAHLLKVEIFQNQMKASAVVEDRGGKIYFSKTLEGKTKTAEEKRESTFVMAANFQRFVRENWPKIKSGDALEFRYGVWDRMETVGFSLFKVGEETLSGTPALVLKMKPSSFIIAALVKPIIFKFSADGSKLLEMNGRVPVKTQQGASLKDLDAEVVYE